MFERRLKFFLVLLACVTAMLIARALQEQFINRHHWEVLAASTLAPPTQYIDAPRGRLLDCKMRPIAMDVPSMDACVAYPAIALEPYDKHVLDWIHDRAVERIITRRGPKPRPSRAEIADEIESVKGDIAVMWHQLAVESGTGDQEMLDRRRDIIHKVEMRRRHVWYEKRQLAETAAAAATKPSLIGNKPTTNPLSEPPLAVQQWLAGDTDVCPFDGFDIQLSEQSDAHMIVRAISQAVYNRIGKQLEHFPGLVLRSNMERNYPYADAACHVLGQVSHVEAKDLQHDTHAGDKVREYRRNDAIGRGGLEELCEPLLRGTRGTSSTVNADDGIEPVRGIDVQTTLDIELEQSIRAAFDQIPVQWSENGPIRKIDLHGAAVVIDVKTGEVRAMVSVPTFDANQYDLLYPSMRRDNLNQPLVNLATEAALETGSTIKPVVGIGAITQGVMGLNDTIECTGYLVIGGKKYPFGRCWVASKFAGDPRVPSVAHHPVPSWAPHPTGFLTFPDALERSCNIFFENMGDRLGLNGLSHWMDVFGLGRSTGIGISEVHGRLPNTAPATLSEAALDQAKWFGGIGQGYVAATPLQMANVAATVARDGVWMRPHLLESNAMHELVEADQNSSPPWMRVPERVVLPISPAAVAAAREGMYRVANSPAGTGVLNREDGLIAAGKTGTAQAAAMAIPTLDEQTNKPVLDANGKPLRTILAPSTYEHSNPIAPWYLGFEKDGTELKHSWYIGYAPADHPRVAFAVLVEYGGSGGGPAKFIANKIMDACLEQGYILLDHPISHAATQPAP